MTIASADPDRQEAVEGRELLEDGALSGRCLGDARHSWALACAARSATTMNASTWRCILCRVSWKAASLMTVGAFDRCRVGEAPVDALWGAGKDRALLCRAGRRR